MIAAAAAATARAQARVTVSLPAPGLPVYVQVCAGICRHVPVSVSESISSFHKCGSAHFDSGYLMHIYSWFAPGLSWVCTFSPVHISSYGEMTNNQASFGGSLLKNNMEAEAAMDTRIQRQHLDSDETGVQRVCTNYVL